MSTSTPHNQSAEDPGFSHAGGQTHGGQPRPGQPQTNQPHGNQNQDLPNLADCGHFDGETAAARWLQRVKWEFRRVGVTAGSDRCPEIIEAVNMLCEGKAAVFLDSSAILQAIIGRAERNKSNPDDLTILETSLREKFPTRLVDELAVLPAEDLQSLSQESTESLVSYYARTQALLTRMGGRDRPRGRQDGTGDTSLSALESFTLGSVVRSFVDGLHDDELKAESIDKSAAGKDSLWGCFDAIRDSQKILDNKITAREKRAKELRVKMMENVIWASTGLPVEQALAKSYPDITLPSMVTPMEGSMSLISNSQVIVPQVSLLSGDVYNQRVNLNPKPFWQSNQAPQQTQVATGRDQAQGRARVAWSAPPATSAAPPPAPSFPPNGPLPPRESSTHPMINGKEKLNSNVRVCFRCGKHNHIKPQCPAVEDECLKPWEQTHLRNMITAMRFPPTNPQTVGSSSAQMVGDVKTPMRTEDLTQMHPDRLSKLFGEQVEEVVTSDGALGAGEATVGSHSCTLYTEDPDKPPGKKDDTEEEDEMRSQVLYLTALLTEAVKRSNKRRRGEDGAIPVESLLNDPVEEEISESAAQPAPVSKPRQKRRPREIQGRQGGGPFDWKKLANEIEVKMSLMDLFQVSPEGSSALKHMATRVTTKTRKKARKIATATGAGKGVRFDLNSNGATVICSTKVAYRVTPTIKYTHGSKTLTRTLPENSALTDQGSDINIISDSAVRKLSLTRRMLADLGIESLFIKTSTGESARVFEFVVINMGVMSIWRSVWAIIRPVTLKIEDESEVSIILGLPWLWEVAAFIDIRAGTLWIGEKSRGEPRVKVKGPVMGLSHHHRLCLTRDGPPLSLDPGAVIEEDVSEDDSDTDDSNSENDSDDSEEASEN
ncbi:hypothetical protein E0Z10_g8845 [Xylaria hypoxylon]|uniref:CCHC-type domain-containing protein n=1 Tax=Xylaria hypoxylon TaxID=37992 RepID=A0A4Z0YLX0_9PEZI|nr:hypothetical protein E0Z10_g8845 [Xylaria hypoxylon]